MNIYSPSNILIRPISDIKMPLIALLQLNIHVATGLNFPEGIRYAVFATSTMKYENGDSIRGEVPLEGVRG